MKIILAIVLIGFVAYSESINVSQCPGRERAIPELSNLVTVGNCKKPPCRLRKNTQIPITMKFKPQKDVEKLKNSVFAYIVGVPFPFIGVDETDACGFVYKADGETKAPCPLKAGEEYVYKNSIDVLEIYPRIKLTVHWALKSPNGDEICFEVPSRITN